MLNEVTTIYDDNNNEGRRVLIIDQNDNDNGGVGLDFDDKLNEDNDRT